jgi:hypothetical protein
MHFRHMMQLINYKLNHHKGDLIVAVCTYSHLNLLLSFWPINWTRLPSIWQSCSQGHPEMFKGVSVLHTCPLQMVTFRMSSTNLSVSKHDIFINKSRHVNILVLLTCFIDLVNGRASQKSWTCMTTTLTVIYTQDQYILNHWTKSEGGYILLHNSLLYIWQFKLTRMRRL